MQKSVVVRYTKRNQHAINFQYSIQGTCSPVESKIKDLGVIFDERFSFSCHIIDICKGAFRKLGFLRRCSTFLKKISTFKL